MADEAVAVLYGQILVGSPVCLLNRQDCDRSLSHLRPELGDGIIIRRTVTVLGSHAHRLLAHSRPVDFAMTLLEHGADADLTNNAGKSARSIAAESKFDSVRDLF